MGQAAKRLEVVANAAIIGVSILLSVVVVKKFLLQGEARTPTYPVPANGSKLPLPNASSEGAGNTLLLILDKHCPFCAESAPFYRALAAAESPRKARLMVVMSDPPDVIREYLKAHDVPVRDVLQLDRSKLAVGGVPTLLFLDQQGVVRQAWRGRLDPADQAVVLSRIAAD